MLTCYTEEHPMTLLIEAILDRIRRELERQYWNTYHKVMLASPFDNTGVIYYNPVFTVRAYNWDQNDKPNFHYKNTDIWWYKYCGRGMLIKSADDLTTEYFTTMLKDCFEAINKDYKIRKEQ